MRQVVWAAVLLLAFGMILSAASLSGFWGTQLMLFDTAGTLPGSIMLSSTMATEFHLGDWTFADLTWLRSDVTMGLMQFTATGPLGAFEVFSSMTFGEFLGTDSFGFVATRTSLGGIGLWGVAALRNGGILGNTMGFLLGTFGSIGSVELYSEIGFGTGPYTSLFIMQEGLDAVWRMMAVCGLPVSIAGSGCGPSFTYLNVYTKIPLSCFDVETWTYFSPEGFSFSHLWISEVDLGLFGLMWDRLQITFAPDSKQVLFNFGFRLGETICFTPYVSVMEDLAASRIDGLSFDALEMVCTVGDVTVIVSDIVDWDPPAPPIYVLGDDARIHRNDMVGIPGDDCYTLVEASEGIGIEVGRSGCCANTFYLGLYAFFSTDLPGTSLFGWSETHLGIRYGAAPNFTVSGQLVVVNQGPTRLQLGFELLWGNPTFFGPEWQNSCCTQFVI